MKVIFLDVDGVLNSEDYLDNRKKPEDEYDIDEYAIKILKEIVCETNAYIVLSSSWRVGQGYYAVREKLREFGLDLLDKTPRFIGKQRGIEIESWLQLHEGEIERFVILDDDTDMAHLVFHLVKTNFRDGLTEKHIPKVLEILN